eukprot:11761753-Alexandrium_andersonii.AAC.1
MAMGFKRTESCAGCLHAPQVGRQNPGVCVLGHARVRARTIGALCLRVWSPAFVQAMRPKR